VRSGLVLLALLPLLALASCHQAFGTDPHGAGATGPGQGTLTNIRTGAHSGYDRVVFDFAGPATASTAEYVPRTALKGTNDQPVVPRGNYYLRVRFSDTLTQGSTPDRVTPLRAEVRDIRQVESFEAVVVYVIGVQAKHGFRVFTLTKPNRVVVDVAR
jgi:hypothetical protein